MEVAMAARRVPVKGLKGSLLLLADLEATCNQDNIKNGTSRLHAPHPTSHVPRPTSHATRHTPSAWAMRLPGMLLCRAPRQHLKPYTSDAAEIRRQDLQRQEDSPESSRLNNGLIHEKFDVVSPSVIMEAAVSLFRGSGEPGRQDARANEPGRPSPFLLLR
ncbi:hypothetical protein E2C01_035007 [Portunus trituberculatus]|uniref:Uncharacterized protein n=1 Tax=Portunus trituberculatus TaxID=210409 RepID=A0A5B7F7X4_PORTR|nr:hypothetical protein [Portunus trituberculatus]